VCFCNRVLRIVASAFVVFAVGVHSDSLALAASPGQRTLVVIDESLAVDAKEGLRRAQALGRRLEVALEQKSGSLRVRWFSDVDAGLKALRQRGVAFAWLSTYAYVRAQAVRKKSLRVLAYARGLQGTTEKLSFVGRSGSGTAGTLPAFGKKLAGISVADAQWIRILFDGHINPRKHFELMPTSSMAEGVQAVLDGQADLAVVDEVGLHPYRRLLSGRGPRLQIKFRTQALPTRTLVALRAARKKETKTLMSNPNVLCAEREGREACSDLGVILLKSGGHELHEQLVLKYKLYK